MSRWIRGKQHPAFSELCEIAEKFGWQMGDVDAPPPPPEEEPEPPTRLIGHLSDKDGTGAELVRGDARTIESLGEVWLRSKYHHLIAGSQIVYVEVRGKSMEPQFPDGCLLACSRPATSDLPDLTPIIATAEGRTTFKLHRVVQNAHGRREVELIPINRCLDIQRFKPREVSVEYVVLGFMSPWGRGALPASLP